MESSLDQYISDPGMIHRVNKDPCIFGIICSMSNVNSIDKAPISGDLQGIISIPAVNRGIGGTIPEKIQSLVNNDRLVVDTRKHLDGVIRERSVNCFLNPIEWPLCTSIASIRSRSGNIIRMHDPGFEIDMIGYSVTLSIRIIRGVVRT